MRSAVFDNVGFLGVTVAMRRRVCLSGGSAAGASAKIVLVNARFQLERLDVSSLVKRERIENRGRVLENLRYLANNDVAITEGFVKALRETPSVKGFFAEKDLTSIDFEKNSFTAMKSFNAAFRDHIKRIRAKEGPYFIELGIIFESRRPNYGGAIFLLKTAAEE